MLLKFTLLLYLALLWLRRRRSARAKAILARGITRRARVRQLLLMQQDEQAGFMSFLSSHMERACLNQRKIWIKPRIHSFFPDIAKNWTDHEWKQNF